MSSSQPQPGQIVIDLTECGDSSCIPMPVANFGDDNDNDFDELSAPPVLGNPPQISVIARSKQTGRNHDERPVKKKPRTNDNGINHQSQAPCASPPKIVVKFNAKKKSEPVKAETISFGAGAPMKTESVFEYIHKIEIRKRDHVLPTVLHKETENNIRQPAPTYNVNATPPKQTESPVALPRPTHNTPAVPEKSEAFLNHRNRHGVTECQLCFLPVEERKGTKITEHCVCKECAKSLKKSSTSSGDVVSYYCLMCKKLVPAQIYDEDEEEDDDDCDKELELDQAALRKWLRFSNALSTCETQMVESVEKVVSHLNSVREELLDAFTRIAYKINVLINRRQESVESEFRKAVHECDKYNSIIKRKELLENALQRTVSITASLKRAVLCAGNAGMEAIDVYVSAVKSQSLAVVDALATIEMEYYKTEDNESNEECSEGKWEEGPTLKVPHISTNDAISYGSHASMKRDLDKINVFFDKTHIVELINKLNEYQC